jgi:UDP-glucose 4-epimerase
MITVTGASGFLGSTVVRRALAAGLDVVPVARRMLDGAAAARAVVIPSYADLAPRSAGDVLLHLAESPLASPVREGPLSTVELVKRLLDRPWRHVVYASSAAVYGDAQPHPRRETEEPAPASDYARAKLACEALVLAAGGTALRCSNLYGPGLARQSVLGDILSQLGREGPVRLRDLSPVRDFLYVDDAADAFLAAATQLHAGAFNVGAGVGTNVETLARKLLAAAGEPDRAIVAGEPQGRASTLILDPALWMSTSGWRPETGLDEGLEKLVRSQR